MIVFSINHSIAQVHDKVSGYLLGQFTNTIYDRTTDNNPWGMGLGFQLFLNNRSKWSPTFDATADIYFADDKVYRMNTDGSEIVDIGGVINLFGGASFHLSKLVYFSLVGGPSFIGGQTLFGIKPSIGFYFSENQKWTGKFSYINVFGRDNTTKQDFGSVSIGIGVKIF